MLFKKLSTTAMTTPTIIFTITSISLALLSGCKTVKYLQSQPIDTIVIDKESREILPSVDCRFSDVLHNQYEIKKNPGSVIIPQGRDKLYLACEAPDYYQMQIAVSHSMTGWTYRDLTLLPGNILDLPALGLKSYPSQVIIFMSHHPEPPIDLAEKQFKIDQEKEVFFQGTLAK